MRLLPMTWMIDILRNAPGEGSGGAAADAGGAAETGTGAAADDPVVSALSRTPPGKEGEDAASDEAAKEGEGKEGDDKAKEGDTPDPADVVPEDGVYKYTLPEGMTADDAVSDAMNPVFKEAGLTQKQVDTVVGEYAKLVQKDQEARAGKVDETLTGWLDAAKNDPEIGGDKWDQSVKEANSVLDRFGDDDIDAALQQTGAGAHPAIIRLLTRVGKAIADDTFTTGKRAETEKLSFEDKMYADTTPASKRA